MHHPRGLQLAMAAGHYVLARPYIDTRFRQEPVLQTWKQKSLSALRQRPELQQARFTR